MKGKKKILIVEDDIQNLMIYEIYLSNLYELKLCANENDFHDALREDTYALFIIDLALNSTKNGIDLIKELRQIEKYSKTSVIVVTAFALNSDRKISMEAGANEFISKPFKKDTLLKVIQKYMQEDSVETILMSE